MVCTEALQRVQKAVKVYFFLQQNEIRTSLQSLKLNQSELKCVLPPGILVCVYISKHNFNTRLIKHEFEHTVGITSDKQHIVINCLEIWQNLLYTMVFTRAQLDTLSRKELVAQT